MEIPYQVVQARQICYSSLDRINLSCVKSGVFLRALALLYLAVLA